MLPLGADSSVRFPSLTERWRSHLRCPPSIALLAAGLALGAATAPAGAAPFAEVARTGGLHDLGHVAPAQRLDLAVLLAYRHRSELEQLVLAQSDAASPLYHRYLRPDQFADYFAPAPGDLARVVTSLRAAGFTVTRVYSNRTIVDATAPAAVVERYFGTDIHSVTQAGYGERYVNVTPASAPSSVRDVLAESSGFRTSVTFTKISPGLRASGPRSAAATSSDPTAATGRPPFSAHTTCPARTASTARVKRPAS
jgi:hypothetical protein